ncbi:MAG: hypothetical protein NC218_02490 [Acetobacter sp.]|nr:hypothetical protein [Acetobacter sp.]
MEKHLQQILALNKLRQEMLSVSVEMFGYSINISLSQNGGASAIELAERDGGFNVCLVDENFPLIELVSLFISFDEIESIDARKILYANRSVFNEHKKLHNLLVKKEAK